MNNRSSNTSPGRMPLPSRSRRKPERAITIAGPRSLKQVTDRDLRAEGRARIAQAALPLFQKYGYHATPVRLIAQAARISSGSIFNYFAGKDEILQFILEESQAQAERAIHDAQKTLAASHGALEPVDLFLQVYRSYGESIDVIRRYTLLAYQEAKSLTPAQRAPLLEREQRIADLLKAAAEPAIRAGLFTREALDLRVHALIVLVHAWAVRHWAWTQYPTVSEYLDDLDKLAVALMSGPVRESVRNDASARVASPRGDARARRKRR